jgi:hypothetical protein
VTCFIFCKRPGKPLRYISVTNDHGYVLFVVFINRSFPLSWLITEFVLRVTQTATHPEHMNSLPFLVGFLLSIYSFLCSVLKITFYLFPFGHGIFCSSSVYDFSWYRQTFFGLFDTLSRIIICPSTFKFDTIDTFWWCQRYKHMLYTFLLHDLNFNWIVMVQHVIYILLWYLISYNPTKVKHHLTCFNNIFSNTELISNRFAVFVTCTHMLTYLWNRLLIDFNLCVYDRVCKVPRVLFNICVCERKLIFFV